MPPSLETQIRIAELREKGRAGTLTLEDCQEAIAFLRAERLLLPATKSRTKEPPPNVGDLLGELGIKS